MKTFALLLSLVTVYLVAVSPTEAGSTVFVTVTGTVEGNFIRNSPIDRDHVTAGSPVLMTFELDSSDYLDSGLYPVRGYAIDHSSFSLLMNGIDVGLENPYPAGQTPYFAIRDNDPGVDGFMLTSFVDTSFPEGLPTDEPGVFGQFFDSFYVTYEGTRLPSLDILDALGTYDYTGLQVFNWTMDDGAYGPNAMYINFEQMTITPEPATLSLLSLSVVGLVRRRRA